MCWPRRRTPFGVARALTHIWPQSASSASLRWRRRRTARNFRQIGAALGRLPVAVNRRQERLDPAVELLGGEDQVVAPHRFPRRQQLALLPGSVVVREQLCAVTQPDPGEGPPLHVHRSEDELLYVLAGEFRFRLGGADSDAAAGSFVFVPKGTPHTWLNAGSERGRLLIVFTPAAPGMERFFIQASDLADDASIQEAFAEFAAGSGMDVLGPPLSG